LQLRDALRFERIFELLTKTHIQNGDAPKVGVIFVREQYSRAILNEAIMEIRYRYQYRKSCIGVYSFLEMPHSTQFFAQ
jgi:hypothetical protein